ncbi:MAG: EAL domain-containing protein [Desulfobulbaceae bacterium]|nr:EAL domain-containing protein [Desulfobulbaceae bacterium]
MNPDQLIREKPLALIVDDDLSLRIAMSAVLKKVGFSVIEVDNGKDGVDAFKKSRPDFILLDVIMPVLDGYKACKAIRSLPGGDYVQILMATGLDDSRSIDSAFEAGANGYITKPLNWTVLGHRARYMLKAGRAFRELNKSKTRLAKTQELAKLGNWELNLNTGEFICSKEATVLLGGLSKDGILRLGDLLAPVHPDELSTVTKEIEAALAAQESFSIDYRIVLPDGSTRYILNQGEILYSDDNGAGVMLGAIQDVTQLKAAEEEIRLLAYYDGLTGLANRMLFLDRLDQEIAAAKRSGQKLALLYMDLDQFKRINDTLGHHHGDLLLKKVSDVLQRTIRGTDTASILSRVQSASVVARLGGDEFTILLSELKEPEHAAVVARRILKEIAGPYMLEGYEVSVTTSIGISIYPGDGLDGTLLLKHADTAMYHAKNHGRNNYKFYTKALNVEVVERFSIERDIPKAIEDDEFALYYQPKINVKSGEIVGAEALIRWHHPYRGLVPPDRFIAIAEESGLIKGVNDWVLKTVCSQWHQWKSTGLDPGVLAINLSGYQLAKQNVLEAIAQNEIYDLDFSKLEVEITENILMQDTKGNAQVLQYLHDYGIRIALDDFGTGYSSLSYLTSFKVDTLKIDRSFVMGCVETPKNLVVINAIIAMGHSLGMKVVAEGVETGEEFELMKQMGVDEVQGFFFSPAVPADDFARLLLEQKD